MLIKRPDDLLTTDIPDHVYEGLKASPVTDVHVFGRRGPAQVKFSPLELREALHIEGVQSIVYDEDFQYDDGSQAAIDSNNQIRVMVKTLEDLRQNPQAFEERRLHLHFFSAPVEVLGEDGKVVGLRVQHTKLDGTGNVTPIDEFETFPIQAVYRAVGYFGSPVDEIPFDSKYGVIQNSEGRVLDGEGKQIPGVYCTGWIKRGPVGLIGHTKADAIETISHVIADRAMWWTPAKPSEAEILETLDSRGVKYLEWKDWLTLDAKELALGAQDGRERKKLFDREEISSILEGSK
jgi:ferredoxin--NADP+ reductase